MWRYSDRHICCAPGGTRTPNQLIRSQALYPLSYEGISYPDYTAMIYFMQLIETAHLIVKSTQFLNHVPERGSPDWKYQNNPPVITNKAPSPKNTSNPNGNKRFSASYYSSEFRPFCQ